MLHFIFVLLIIEKLVLISGLEYSLDLPEGADCRYDTYNGTCVKQYRCLSALDIIGQTTDFPPLCNFDGEYAVVCCPDCILVNDISHIPDIRYTVIKFWKGKRAHDKCLEYLDSLPYECKWHTKVTATFSWSDKKKCKDRIFVAVSPSGGENAERYEYPHMALLGYGDDLSSIQWLCGGSIISERFILTAAHCISTPRLGKVTYIAVGMLKRSDPPEYWHHYKVKRIIPYPEYKSPIRYHDIALLETERQMNFSKAVLPACMDTTDYFYESNRGSLDATGWGNLGHEKPTADTLQTVILEEFAYDECAKMYPSHRLFKHGFDNTTQMCYGSHEHDKDTCQGDSGGPLQQRVHISCQFEIVGLTSFGNPCGRKGGAGLYTRVDYYIPWIENIVWPIERVVGQDFTD